MDATEPAAEVFVVIGETPGRDFEFPAGVFSSRAEADETAHRMMAEEAVEGFPLYGSVYVCSYTVGERISGLSGEPTPVLVLDRKLKL